MYARLFSGHLIPLRSFSTGGEGTGSGLGSQGAVRLTDDRRFLLAVNAGSDELSVFFVSRFGLFLTDVVPSGGEQPVSVDVHDGLVFVLNGGGVNNVAGFALTPFGRLLPIPGSARPLSVDSTGPAQVEFSPDGSRLVVTEKATSLVDTFRVGPFGFLFDFTAHVSSGMTPFGFVFRGDDQLVVSEAFGGAADASAVSTYRFDGPSSIAPISPSVPTTETAACWIAMTEDGRYAYATNTGSNSITGYRVTPGGMLELLDADGETAETAAAPLDFAFADGSRFLYVLESGNGSVSAFFRLDGGGLVRIQSPIGGLPPGSAGLAAF
jgi:6-phosphogluconolactonase (cycloisomerase 2 family)